MPFSTQRPQRISFYNQDSLPFINEPRARAWDVHPMSMLSLSRLREGIDRRALAWREALVHIDDPLPELICFAIDTSSFEHIELPAKLLYYFLRGNKTTSINCSWVSKGMHWIITNLKNWYQFQCFLFIFECLHNIFWTEFSFLSKKRKFIKETLIWNLFQHQENIWNLVQHHDLKFGSTPDLKFGSTPRMHKSKFCSENVI